MSTGGVVKWWRVSGALANALDLSAWHSSANISKCRSMHQMLIRAVSGALLCIKGEKLSLQIRSDGINFGKESTKKHLGVHTEGT